MANQGLAQFNQMIHNPKTQDYLTSLYGKNQMVFVNNLTALVANDKALQECTPITIMYAATKATSLNLPLDKSLGFAYVIPFKNNKEKVTEAQFQLGWKGFLQLAMRTGQFRTINVRDVRESEIVGEDFVSGELQFKKADNRETLPVVGYVAYIELTNGFRKMSYWTIKEVEQHAQRYSQSYSSQNEYVKKNSPWSTDFDAMACKTVLKNLLSKYAPMSIEMASGIKYDQAVIREGKDNAEEVAYVDNEPQQKEISAEQQNKAADILAKALNKDNAEEIKPEEPSAE